MANGSSIRFHYRRFGSDDDPALLMLHGFMGSADDWSEEITAPLVAVGSQVLAVDLPGHGRTVADDEDDCFFEYCAAGLMLLLDDLHLESAHLLGYSMGGRLALYLAVRYPNRIGRVVLESASPGLKTMAEREARVAADARLAEQIRSQPLEKFVREWYAQPLFTSMASQTQRLEGLINRRLANDPEGLCRSLQGMGTGAQPPLWENLKQLSKPLLLIAGGKDAKFTAIGREMADRCPVAQLRIVPDAGHNVHFERPHEFTTLVREFLLS